MKRFSAPWGTLLWVMSALGTMVCLGVGLHTHLPWLRLVAFAAIGIAALFSVRGYSVGPDCILVHRLFWSTRLPLADLQWVRARREEDRRGLALRTCGNGGFFSFTGWYWSKALGPYRAFVTDPKRVVILKFTRRTIVLSPGSPEEFIRELTAHAKSP